VLGVVTGDEIRASTTAIPEAINTVALGAQYAPWYALCTDRARYVGEAVAAVVAEDDLTARAARDLVRVQYEPLPVVANAEQALEDGAPWSSRVGSTTSSPVSVLRLVIRPARSSGRTAASAGPSPRPVSRLHRSSRAGRWQGGIPTADS
jgi:CO/xanthine dehydrogenase Mo-binding subunit